MDQDAVVSRPLHWRLRRILQHLWVEDGRSRSELARAVGGSKASIANMLKHLVNGGWGASDGPIRMTAGSRGCFSHREPLTCGLRWRRS